MRVLSLGYPWLVSLSTKQLHRAETKDRRDCVLEVKPISLGNLNLDDPDTISDSSHLFEIRMTLIEIALDSLEDSDPVKLEDHIYMHMHPTNSLSCTKLLAPRTIEVCFLCPRSEVNTILYTNRKIPVP